MCLLFWLLIFLSTCLWILNHRCTFTCVNSKIKKKTVQHCSLFKNTCCTNYSHSYLDGICDLSWPLRAPLLCWQQGGQVVPIRSVKLVLFLAHRYRQRWRLAIIKVIATTEICLFSRQQPQATGRSVGVVTWCSWTGCQTQQQLACKVRACFSSFSIFISIIFVIAKKNGY